MPAKAAYQPTSMLDVLASSRASSLLQVRCHSNNLCSTQILWERACSRWRFAGRSKFCSELNQQPGRPVGRLGCFCGVRPLVRPSGGSAQLATRHGCRVSRPRPWMADGGGPTEQDRSEGMPSLGEAPNVRGKALWLLSRSSKVTRRKGGTNSGRYLNNGYVPDQSAQTKTASCSLYKSRGRSRYNSTRYSKTALTCGLPAW